MTVAPGQQPLETIGPVLSDLDAAEQERSFSHLATRQICPFLAIDGGGWRSSSASRDHRCGAVSPPLPLAIDKQRRLCLSDAHLECATFLAATGSSPSGDMQSGRATLGRPGATATPTVTRWSLVRTMPVVLDRNRVPASVGAIARDRRAGQLVLAGLIIAAFGAVAVARLGGGSTNIAGANASSSPAVTARPTASPAAVTPAPSAAATVAPSAVPSAAPTAAVTPAPAPAHQTYTVKSGDTLGGIASRFGTTVDAIAKLNKIARADYGRIQVGRVLLIP